MPYWALLCATLLQAAPGAASAPEPDPTEGQRPWAVMELGPVPRHCSATLQVVGFSDNERAMAVKQHVRCPHNKTELDHFELIDLIELKGGTVLARYQGSPITRTSRARRPVFVPPAQLRAAYPAWGKARPQQAWAKLKRAGHFRLRAHNFQDVMVRVRLDADSPMDVRAEGTKLRLTAPVGKPIGCMVVARLVDGSEIDLGHVRDETPSKRQERGTLEVVFSAHGHVVALVHHGLGQDHLMVTHTRRSDPIASTQVGFLQMLKWDADSVKELYGELHPGGKAIWDEMVGNIE